MRTPRSLFVLGLAPLLSLSVAACSSSNDDGAASLSAAATDARGRRFCPRDLVPRADMARFLERMKRGRDYQPPPATGVFSDVPRESPNAPWIEQLFRDGITKGTSPTTFAPNDTVPREQMAAFIVRLLHGPDFRRDGPSRFSDVTNPDFIGSIEQLADDRITFGCTPTEFCPHDMVPRDQMAAFLMRAIHPGPDPAPTGMFSDLEPGNVLAGRVEQAVSEGIMEDCTGRALTEPTCAETGESRTFPETGQTVSGAFLDYMNRTGGVSGVGLPITGEFRSVGIDGREYTTQCFERRVLEKHPENGCDYYVQGRQLGRIQLENVYPSGAVEQWPTDDPGRTYFPETGKHVSSRFKRHWDETGGLRENGYPITDEIREDGRIVQYFERAVFEDHPENGPPYDVQGRLLGSMDRECAMAAGWPSPLSTPSPPPRSSSTVDRTAFLELASNDAGFAQVSHQKDAWNPLDCSSNYTINYLVETGEVTPTSVYVKAITVYYHPPAGTWIWPWGMSVWSSNGPSIMLADEVGTPKTEGNFHRFSVERRFAVKEGTGAVIEFPTAGNGGSVPLTIDTSGTQCGRKGVIVILPRP